MENYYTIIGVKETDDFATIKAEYLSKIKKYHPDLYDGDKLYAENMTAKLNEAYEYIKTNHENKENIPSTPTKKTKENKILNWFKKIWNKIKNYFNLIFKPNKENDTNGLTESELADKRKLNIIILIQAILIIILFILVLIT